MRELAQWQIADLGKAVYTEPVVCVGLRRHFAQPDRVSPTPAIV